MIDSFFRPLYQKIFIDPVLAIPFVRKLSPLSVSLIGILVGILTIPFIAFDFKWIGILLILASGYCDTLDGSLARLQKRSSSMGAAIDIVGDRAVEFSIILGLFFYDPSHRALTTLFMLGSILLCVTSFLVVGIFSQNHSEKSFHYSPGLVERAEAFIFWIAMIIWPESYTYLAYLFISLVLLTTAIRLNQFAITHGKN